MRLIVLILTTGLTDAFLNTPQALAPQQTQVASFSSSSSTAVEIECISSPKEKLLQLLTCGEDENSSTLTPYLDKLQAAYKEADIDARVSVSPTYNGDWVNLNFPNFPGGSGFNELGQPLYTLGRLTFNRIPNGKTTLVAAEKMVQRVHPYDGPLPEHIPKSLEAHVKQDPSKLLTFSIDTYFSIEANRGLKGIMRAEGYVYPHPEIPNRFDSFFARGRCFACTTDYMGWNKIFGGAISKPLKRERMLRWLGAKLKGKPSDKQQVLLEDASLQYSLSGPVAAHARVVYMDDDLRVTIGQEGSCMINTREKNDVTRE